MYIHLIICLDGSYAWERSLERIGAHINPWETRHFHGVAIDGLGVNIAVELLLRPDS